MPRKVFTAGEVLAAADVNEFLMDQAVMTFASSAARGSAIGTAVEGMVTWLNDENALQVYDGTAWNGLAASGGNAIINGGFEINQRGYASAGTLASGAYGFDRWKATAADTTLTFTSAPQGQLVTINSDKGIEQVVERANLPAGTYTLSWQGTATARIYNTGATPPSYAASPITVALDGLADVEVEFTASGGTKTCGFVQLEAGPTANVFRRNANSLAGELAACQRYYYRESAGSATFAFFGNTGIGVSSTNVILPFRVPVEMRVLPTSVEFSNLAISDINTNNAVSALTLDVNGTRQTVVISITSTGLTQFRPYAIRANNSTAAFLGFSAEL
jgi:hypothetical protein